MLWPAWKKNLVTFRCWQILHKFLKSLKTIQKLFFSVLWLCFCILLLRCEVNKTVNMHTNYRIVFYGTHEPFDADLCALCVKQTVCGFVRSVWNTLSIWMESRVVDYASRSGFSVQAYRQWVIEYHLQFHLQLWSLPPGSWSPWWLGGTLSLCSRNLSAETQRKLTVCINIMSTAQSQEEGTCSFKRIRRRGRGLQHTGDSTATKVWGLIGPLYQHFKCLCGNDMQYTTKPRNECVCVCLNTPSTYLSGCQGNKVIDSEWDDLPKKADDDPPHLVTCHCDVKKHLDTHTNTHAQKDCRPIRGVKWQ